MAKTKSKIVPIREPNGRLSRASEDAVQAMAPAAVRRLRDAAAKRMADPEWGTEIGRLFLEGKIPPELFEAGKRWGRLVVAYHKAIGAKPPYPKSASFSGEGGTVEPDPDSQLGKQRAKKERAIVSDMMEAHAVLIGAGKLAEIAVRSVCESNESPVGTVGHESLVRGLSWIALHWGLTQQPTRVRIPK